MTEPWVIGALVVLAVAQFLVIARLLDRLERQAREHAEQVERLLVLQRSETLDQYAAVEARLRRGRLEDARDLVHRGTAEGEPVAKKRPGVLDLVWRRPPTARRAPEPEAEQTTTLPES